MNIHLQYMNLAYDLALRGWGRVSPNPMVGAVIVKSDKVIAEGWHEQYGGLHAEAVALKKAGSKAKGADLYVTLEPCGHFGKTPPCATAIIEAGIKRVFIGALDPNRLMNGKSVAALRKAKIKVEVGFLQDELTRMNEGFNKFITTGMPFVTAKIAQTLDGKIANTTGESKWITGDETRSFAHEMRFGVDAIMVGINTVLKDDPALNSTPPKKIKKIVLDTHLRMPSKGKIYQSTLAEDVLVFTASKTKKNIKATIIQAPLKDKHVDLKWVIDYLGQHQIANVLIEGGAHVIGNALQVGIVDKMMIYVAPKIMGEGLDAVQGVSTPRLDKILNLKDIQVGKIGNDLLIEGYVK